jgi:hypothetical protein
MFCRVLPTETPIPITKSPRTTTNYVDRHAMQQERARALFAKYGLTLETHEWISAPAPVPAVERVEKSIRMRVHRSCHHCGEGVLAVRAHEVQEMPSLSQEEVVSWQREGSKRQC